MTPKGYAPPLARLISELSRFPGIGEKTAARMANFILRGDLEAAKRLSQAIVEVKEKIGLCRHCFNLADGELCVICKDDRRDPGLICVVEDPDALLAIEECGSYKGRYHVLHGCLAPLDGIGPEELKLKELKDRLAAGGIREVIIATNPTSQGEATAVLISDLLKSLPVKVSRIATGIPIGGDLKYSDRMTLIRSLEWRRRMEEEG